ncbi:MAG: cysteine--tRNA ligase [Bacillota bacterium]
MSVKVYNTLTRRKEEFVPRDPGKVAVYVCGPTPYDYAHIGNARPPVVWDVIRRFLVYLGYEVTLVQNFTDIEDKIIRRALEEKRDVRELSAFYSRIYLEDLEALGVTPPAFTPKVSEHMPEIIEMTRVLVEKGHAYVMDGDVYFDITSFPAYGKLSGRSREEMLAGARVEVDERKKDPMDFALWKKARPGEPAWDSPWGPGRPGWHIECSAMSLKYLGPDFDFHGGGTDLIFPHHENEIAQAEAFNGKRFARYWVHNAFITINNERMGKSLGNYRTIRQVRSVYPPEVIRLFLLGTHYRNPLNFGEEELQAARGGLARIREAYKNWEFIAEKKEDAEGEDSPVLAEEPEAAKKEFIEVMSDDFNTPQALAVVYDMIRRINKITGEKDFSITARNRRNLERAVQILRELAGEVLGLALEAPDRAVDREIQAKVEERQKARAAKDWAAADRIRDELKEMGIVLEDTPYGIRWKRI